MSHNPSSRKRYVLHPGWVTSKEDGDRHFIGAESLARLYGVDMRDCVISDPSALAPMICPREGDVHLRPRRSGNYTVPKEASDD